MDEILKRKSNFLTQFIGLNFYYIVIRLAVTRVVIMKNKKNVKAQNDYEVPKVLFFFNFNKKVNELLFIYYFLKSFNL